MKKPMLISLVLATILATAVGLWGVFKVMTVADQVSRLSLDSRCKVSVFGIAESLSRQPKLIVQTALITVDQSLENENILQLGGFAFEIGNSNLRLVSMGNKVQYYIPMEKITDGDIIWNADERKLTVVVPEPIVDENFIELQQDPKQIIILGKSSWVDWASGKKSALEDAAKNNMRDYVIRAAKTSYYRDLAKENATRELKRILTAIIQPMVADATIQVEYR